MTNTEYLSGQEFFVVLTEKHGLSEGNARDFIDMTKKTRLHNGKSYSRGGLSAHYDPLRGFRVLETHSDIPPDH